MRKSRANLAKIQAYFEALTENAFSHSDLLAILESQKSNENLPRSMGPKAFIEMLLRNTKLSRITLEAKHYPTIVRYTWGEGSPLFVALSIKKPAYLSHGSAMWIHGIGGAADEIYANTEQSEKSADHSPLTQVAINRAFRNSQRRSNLIYNFNNVRITVLSGKNTGRLEILAARAPSGERVQATSLERTLIDITVRPAYAGGPTQIIEAFRLARERISVDKLLRILKLLKYVYPFHQSIGFLHETKRVFKRGSRTR